MVAVSGGREGWGLVGFFLPTFLWKDRWSHRNTEARVPEATFLATASGTTLGGIGSACWDLVLGPATQRACSPSDGGPRGATPPAQQKQEAWRPSARQHCRVNVPAMTMHDDQVDVTAETVAALIQDQFPRWSGEEIRLLPSTGTVNAIFRIGNDLSARFPLRRADAAEARAVLEREAGASAELARVSPFPTPEPVALGEPGAGCPMPWSVQTWLPGTVATDADPSASEAFAQDLATFVSALRKAGTRGRCFSGEGRGGVLTHHDAWMEECFEKSEGLLDVPRLRQVRRTG